MAADEARELGERIDTLLEGLRELPDPDVADRIGQLVTAIVDLYGTGLARVVAGLRAEPDGDARLRALAADELVAHLLMLHDLHPDDVDTRIQRALDGVRPYLGSHAGGVEYAGVDGDGVAHLRLAGSCDGCPSSTVTVKLAIERAVLDAAPEVAEVAVEGMVSNEPKLLQIPPFRPSSPPTSADQDGQGWKRLDFPPGAGTRAQRIGELDVLVCDLGGTPYAYRNACPACGSPLHDGRLDGDRLRCPGCAAGYDMRLAGRPESPGAPSLEALPVLADGDGWTVAVPSPAGV